MRTCILLACACLAVSGGCPTGSTTDGGSTVFARTGRFTGTLTCTQTNSAPTSTPVDYTINLAVEIRTNGEILINGYFYYLGAINPIVLYDYSSTETVTSLTVTADQILIQSQTESFLQDDNLAFQGTKTITLTPDASGGLNYTFRWFDTSQPPAAAFAVETNCQATLAPQ